MDEFMTNWVKKFGGWLPILIVFASVYLKGFYIKTYVSSIDDNLVASSIIYGKKPFNESKVRITINDQVKPTYHSLPKKIARKLDSTGHLMPVLRKLHFLFPLYAVPNETTYAPLQFFFTVFLVRDTQSMFTNIVMGRLPSLVIHTLGLLLFLYLIVKYFKGSENTFSLCFSLLVFSFSFEHVIYSFQMESYAIGVFGFLLLTILYLKYLEKYLIDIKSSFISIGLVCVLLMLMQYQLLFFSFAAVCGIVYYSVRSKLPFRVLFRRIFFSGIIFLLFFIPIFIMFLSKHTEHVAKFLIGGKDGVFSKYWFPAYSIVDWKDGVSYFFKFFSLNLLEVFRSMTFLFTPYSISETLVFGINFILFSIGIVFVLMTRNDIQLQRLKIFFLFSSMVWLGLIISGKIALTPDRHSLILLPIFVFFIYYGSVYTLNLINNKSLLGEVSGKVVILLFFFTLLFSANNYLRERTEPLFIARIDESSVTDSSLIITDDRMFYLFSRQKNAAIFLDTKDESRRGWLAHPINGNYIPKRIYFIWRDQRNWSSEKKAQFDFKKSFDCLPEQIKLENKSLNDLFVTQKFKMKLDTVYTVIEDEVNSTFYKKREEWILIFEKDYASRD